MDDRSAKGANFIYAREYIQKEHGADFWERLLATLPADAAAEWRRPLVPVATYSFAAFKAMSAAYAQATHARGEIATSRLYEYIADRSLNALYKVFFRMTQPAFVIGNYPKLWQRFFTTGSVKVPTAEKGHAVLEFTLPATFCDWLPPACLGYSRKAVEMAGGRELVLHPLGTTRLPDGNCQTRYDLRWQE